MRVTQSLLAGSLRIAVASLLIGYCAKEAFPQSNGVLREVWTGIPGDSIQYLLENENYPASPTIKDTLPGFATPPAFSSNYGTRLRAYLTPATSGEYTFWIQGDDNCLLYLSGDSSEANAQLIASVPQYTSASEWEKYPEQRSSKITLQAGQRYYIEALHKEGSGGDFLNVQWDLEGSFDRRPIASELLAPPENAPAYDPSRDLYIEAGTPKNIYLPANEFQLNGSAYSRTQNSDTLAISWTQTSGLPSNLSQADTLDPTITASTPGLRTYQLSVTSESDTRTDEISVQVHAPLAEGTGTFLQEIWLEVDGSKIETLLNHSDYPARPHLIREVSELVGPRHWADRYGVRTRGLLTPPASGNYTFYVSGDDDTALFLSPSSDPADSELVAFTPESTSENEWTKFPEQSSEAIPLEKGVQYHLDLLFISRWGGDHHAVAWSVDGGPIQPIGGEFFVAREETRDTAPDFESATLFTVEAGQDRTLHSPDNSLTLRGETLRIRESYSIESITWSQLSGPSTAEFSSPNELETTVTFSDEGTWTFQLTVSADGIETSDTVVVTVAPALTSSTGAFTRQVWLDIRGSSVEDLTNHYDFPQSPHIVDQLAELSGPVNWETNYGSRSTGLLIPSRTGQHTFYITADDSAVLSISSNASPASLSQIASTTKRSKGDFRDESQISAPIELVAGQPYFIEVLHKQSYGNDHFQVSWSFGDEKYPTPIGGGNLEPSDPTALPLNPTLPEYAYAGPDRHYYSPTKSFDLIGDILHVSGEDNFRSVTWTYLGSDENVKIQNPTSLSAAASVPGEGTYQFRLTVATTGQTHYDDVSIQILPALSDKTRGLNRSVWLDVEGSMIDDLLISDPLLRSPSFDDIIPSLETPSNWTDYYGTHIIGYVHPPVSGDYTFWLAGDDSAELYLSTSESPEQSSLIAYMENAVSSRYWDRYETQKSTPVTLEAGKKYFIEVLHKEGKYADNLAVAWSGPGLNPREVITAGYLSPLFNSSPQASEILVLAGEDKSLRWPARSIDLFARVYDQDEGPQGLEYQWSASHPDIAFSTPLAVSTNATLPGPGTYTVSLTASDGKSFVTDSLVVTVLPPLAENIGSITREVWLDLPGYRMDDFINDPRFPDSPDLVDNIKSFDLPRGWADDYGTRVRGYIIPPTTGEYQFFVAADDYARVSINTNNQSFDGMTQIIDSKGYAGYREWTRREDQASAPVQLTAGQAYPIEMLHRERNGGDHAVLAWRRPGTEEIEVIDGSVLAPAIEAPAASKNLIVIAPADIHQRWPQNTADLRGRAIDLNHGPESLKTRWEQISGPGYLSFSSNVSLETNVHASEPGTYLIRLYATDGSEEIYDDLTFTLDTALSTRTGAATRSKFIDISGNRVIDMIDSPKYPSSPDTQTPISQLDNVSNNDGDHYGTRVTGYIHPPVSGTYRFSVTGDDWAEVWLSLDHSPENKSMICFTPRATDQYEWDMYPEYQTSSEIELSEGEKYYIEIRHKEHSWRDHFSVAWLRPDAEEMTIIQGAYLSPLDEDSEIETPKISIQGTPTQTIAIGQPFQDPGFAATDGQGNDISDRVVVTNHVDTNQAGTYSIRYQVVNPSTGFAETVVRTVNVVPAESRPAVYPDSSGRPPMVVDWEEPEPSDISDAEASRFLAQATFGPTRGDIDRLQTIGYEAWIDEQFSLEPSLHLEQMRQLQPALYDLGYMPYSDERLATWWTTAIKGEDQLRQRVAFALSQIVVLSDKNTFGRLGLATANYYDILVRNAFGSYEQILQEVTVNPLMGNYLTMLRSDKSAPDENYAREIMQLFSIGLVMLNPDGTTLTDLNGNEIPTYDNELIIELARAFTGWSYAGSSNFYYTHHNETDYFSPMVPFDEHHDFGQKTLTGGFTLPQGLSPTEDLRRAVKHFADHPNVGPFLGLRLIQRLTTSNPSPGYVYRVAKVYEDDGNGQRGNLAAVVKAILLDPEARDPESYARSNYGKLREPILRLTHLLRTFEAETASNPPVFGRYPIHNTTSAFAQSPMQAPSVFNFFLPDYAPPGAIMNAGLVAPEFSITTEITTVDTANFLHESIDHDVPSWWRYSTSIRPDLSKLRALSANTNALLDELDTLLMAGSMSEETRSIIKSVIDPLDNPDSRTKTALKLLITSPEFNIQK